METLLEILSQLHEDVDFEQETALIDDRILDSFDIVTLVAEIDAEFDVAIPAEELAKDVAVQKAMAFVRKKATITTVTEGEAEATEE